MTDRQPMPLRLVDRQVKQAASLRVRSVRVTGSHPAVFRVDLATTGTDDKKGAGTQNVTRIDAAAPRVVIVHDYATQRGGAERVALDLLRAFPGARLVTACYNAESTYPEFAEFDIETLWLDDVAPVRRDPRKGFPFLASAFANHVIEDADLVICSSSGWAHRVQTSAPKIVYCHNPARWLYQPSTYLGSRPAWMRAAFVKLTGRLRRSDTVAAASATKYLVNSTVVAGRVERTYGIDADILFPARGLSPDGEQEPVVGLEPGYLLTVSRARGYKRTDLIVDAVKALPGERLVVVGGEPCDTDGDRVTRLRGLSDAQMRWLYTHAAGLIAVGEEDFGLTPVEAQGFGVPVVALRAGGYLDSTIEGVTGVFVDEPTTEALTRGLVAFRAKHWNRAAIRHHGHRYSKQSFAGEIRAVANDVLARHGSAFDLMPHFARYATELTS